MVGMLGTCKILTCYVFPHFIWHCLPRPQFCLENHFSLKADHFSLKKNPTIGMFKSFFFYSGNGFTMHGYPYTYPHYAYKCFHSIIPGI